MLNRIKGILTAPKTEWTVVEGENESHAKVFTGYVLPLSLIPAIGAFIGYGLIGYSVFGVHVGGSMSFGIRQAIVQWIAMAGGIYLTAFIIDLLAETFGTKKDFNRAFSLVAYAYTPMMVAGVFYILPSLSILATLAGLYGLYLLYVGLQPMMKAPADKNTVYFIVSLVATFVVAAVLSAVLGAILLTSVLF